MSNSSSAGSSGGIGFFGLLGIVFITLKLCGVINWSWWLVLLPIYGPIALVLTVLTLFFMLALIGATIATLFTNK